MRKGLLLVGLLVMLVMLVAGMVRAGDDGTAKPGTPEDNECNPGGVLYREENQDGCPTEWYWKAGWYLARYNRGLLSRADFPTDFASVLPPESIVAPQCWTNGFSSILYVGPPNQLGNTQVYLKSTNCKGTPISSPSEAVFIVFADTVEYATQVCAAQSSVYQLTRLNNVGYASAPADAYACLIAIR